MTEEQSNYGVEPEPEATGGAGPGPRRVQVSQVPASEENTWSMLAHLSVFLNLITGFLGPVAALIIWFMYKDKSARVSFHALQALWYQVAWMVILVIGWTIAGILTVVLIGFLLFPVMLVATLVPFVHMGYAAYQVNQGVDYRYPVIADMIDRGRGPAA